MGLAGLVEFTFYSIYIKTVGHILKQLYRWDLHSTLFILKRLKVSVKSTLTRFTFYSIYIKTEN